MELHRLNLDFKTDGLRKLILENPDLPIVFLAGDSANSGDYGWTYCESVKWYVETILDCDFYDVGDSVITDEDSLEERLSDLFCDKPEYKDMSDEEFDKAIQEKMKEFEPYWKKVIAVYVDN